MDSILSSSSSNRLISFPSFSSSNSRSAERRENSSAFGRIVGAFIEVLITCIFASVGVLLGAVTGGLIGLATESGVLGGTGIGAVSGALVAMEVVERSFAIWRNNSSGIWSIVYVLGVLYSLMTGQLVREKVDPAVQSAVESQMNAADLPFREALDIFETGGNSKGMAKESIDKLPVIKFNRQNLVDASGESFSCSVCLQDFQSGDTARVLPHCKHMFHLPCIDGWLLKHGSCPLCRRVF
ncbi:RING/U-box superfamily protein [Rhynchospora pubera]|uniref:RING/U-box superfamily protein n=1 Tax=Rhynchospora pubera TaxID=906938 RepID=A0AAV8ESP2_9POAL|nr:RING/U-box superfamily protein [Rhynchospora pubera]